MVIFSRATLGRAEKRLRTGEAKAARGKSGQDKSEGRYRLGKERYGAPWKQKGTPVTAPDEASNLPCHGQENKGSSERCVPT